jgi:hypothetical protein
VYVKLAVDAVPSSNCPSASRSHAKVNAPFSGSVEPRASNVTASGAGPVIGLAVTAAVGGRLAAA